MDTPWRPITTRWGVHLNCGERATAQLLRLRGGRPLRIFSVWKNNQAFSFAFVSSLLWNLVGEHPTIPEKERLNCEDDGVDAVIGSNRGLWLFQGLHGSVCVAR